MTPELGRLGANDATGERQSQTEKKPRKVAEPSPDPNSRREKLRYLLRPNRTLITRPRKEGKTVSKEANRLKILGNAAEGTFAYVGPAPASWTKNLKE